LSKKKFTAGLESLFTEGEAVADELQQEDSSLLFPSEEKVEKESRNTATTKRSSKNFTDDMQDFLTDTFEESFERQMAKRKEKPSPNKIIKKRSRRPISGLDLLIRSTVEASGMDIDEKKSRRITLVFDTDKLDKLRSIARDKQTYLKDIIDEIVSEFIDDYEKLA